MAAIRSIGKVISNIIPAVVTSKSRFAVGILYSGIATIDEVDIPLFSFRNCMRFSSCSALISVPYPSAIPCFSSRSASVEEKFPFTRMYGMGVLPPMWESIAFSLLLAL